MSLNELRQRKLIERAEQHAIIEQGPQSEAPPPKPDKPKRTSWNYEGPFDKDKFLDSLIQPKSEINYNSKKAMRNLNNFFQAYGDDLYEEKYNQI